MTFHRGQIVYALDAIPDQNGRNYKTDRPFIVVSQNEYIAVSTDLDGIAISGNVWEADETHIVLPYVIGHGYCHTGLTKPSVAVCTWKVALQQDRIVASKGYIKPYLLEIILQKC